MKQKKEEVCIEDYRSQILRKKKEVVSVTNVFKENENAARWKYFCICNEK